MCSGPDEDNIARPTAIVELVDEQKIAADVAFPVSGPVADQGMVAPLGPQRRLVGNKSQHDLLQAVHIVTARTGQTIQIGRAHV